MHRSNAPPSSAHSNVEPSSLAEKRNVACVAELRVVGPDRIVVSGGVVSFGTWTVQVWLAGDGSTCPSASIARTSTVCGPTARLL
jgi:hypothetical protein